MVDAPPLGPAHFAYSHPTHPVSPSRQDRHRRLEFASTQQPSLSPSPSYPRKPLSQRLRWGVSSNNAGNLPPSSLPPSYAACNARPLSRSSLSYMAIGSCWDRWGRLYSCRRRSIAAALTHCLRASRPSPVARLHRRQCERGGELFAIIVPPPPSPPSTVSWRPSNEFGNFIYEDRENWRGRKGSGGGGGEGPNRKNARCRIR